MSKYIDNYIESTEEKSSKICKKKKFVRQHFWLYILSRIGIILTAIGSIYTAHFALKLVLNLLVDNSDLAWWLAVFLLILIEVARRSTGMAIALGIISKNIASKYLHIGFGFSLLFTLGFSLWGSQLIPDQTFEAPPPVDTTIIRNSNSHKLDSLDLEIMKLDSIPLENRTNSDQANLKRLRREYHAEDNRVEMKVKEAEAEYHVLKRIEKLQKSVGKWALFILALLCEIILTACIYFVAEYYWQTNQEKGNPEPVDLEPTPINGQYNLNGKPSMEVDGKVIGKDSFSNQLSLFSNRLNMRIDSGNLKSAKNYADKIWKWTGLAKEFEKIHGEYPVSLQIQERCRKALERYNKECKVS
jgi:hypothetical protein